MAVSKSYFLNQKAVLVLGRLFYCQSIAYLKYICYIIYRYKNPKMITLNKQCENGARYFHYEEGNTIIRIYVKLGEGEYSYCNVTTNKQWNRMSLPKVWHGENCVLDACESYKNKTYKRAFRAVLCALV